ncbi:MAG: hypothetical protein H6738_20140, partial [Alphaproteobacteria bacterium]|nr:hypothetical protein [Alphaproteobacteria bacterium]
GFEAHLRASFVDSAAVGVAAAAERGSDPAILAAALVQRIRSARAILYDHLVRHLHAVAPEAHAALYLRPAFAGVAPPFTQSSAADEITAWLEAERMRDTIPYPWPPLPLGVAPIPALIRLHEQSAGLEHLLSRFEALAREIGEPLDTLAAWHRERWAEALPTPPRDAGLDVHAQPLRGLAGFPTADPVRCQARLAEAIGEIRALEPPPSPAPLPPSTKRFLDRERATSMPRFDRDHLYAVWAFAEVAGHTCDEESQLVWSQRSEPFTIADPLDVLGLEPTQIQLPDVAAMLKDLPRVPWAGANPFAAVISANDGALVGADPPEDSSRQWGVAFVCSFAIPVFTICAFILFSVIFNILIKIPGFFWMLLLKFCIPLPRRTT